MLQSARPGQRDSKPVLRARRFGLQFNAFIQLLKGFLQVLALGGLRIPQIHSSGVAVGMELNRLFELRQRFIDPPRLGGCAVQVAGVPSDLPELTRALYSTLALRRQTASYQRIARICQKDGRTRS